jgi:hypothetical protein
MQMQCYGLMVREATPTAGVHLILDDGEEHDVPFDSEAQRSITDALTAFVSSMPAPGTLVDAPALAKPGSACLMCSYRAVCTAYLERAPRWWNDYPPGLERLPLDTWGRVIDIRNEDVTSLTLLDDAERQIQIDRIDPSHGLDQAQVGDRIYFFSLKAVGSIHGVNGQRFQPRNYYEIPRDRRERRAWETVAFIDDSN